jgi:RHH-type proline utilization regulon transcriptional repressor/proline dehydrogenase/delta 1-pyrroline-5-carboxylate dehydrogenase
MNTFAPHDLNGRIDEIGRQIFAGADGAGPSIFNKDWWYGNIMEWSMRNEHFKTQMFRFVDVLPCLNDGADVARHLKEYFAESGSELPSVFNFGLGLGSLAPGLMAGAVRKNVQQMARMFIAGENPKEALSALKKARAQGIGFTVDILGEATLTEQEALTYQRLYLELITSLAEDAKSWAPVAGLDQDADGDIPRVNVSVKLSSIFSQINVKAWERTVSTLKDRLRPILRTAIERSVFINIDMESYALKDLTLQVFTELLLEPELRTYPHFGIVIQAYLRDSAADCEAMIKFAQQRGTPLSIRLVKGAYWDYETILAEQRGWPYPVFTDKRESDANCERCAERLLRAAPAIKLCLGSHNIRTIASALAVAEQLRLPKNAFEIQMLYGMGDSFKSSLTAMGYRVREYAPVGQLIPGMAYLVRRLLENTSNESFLRSKFAEATETSQLLADPARNISPSSDRPTAKAVFDNLPLVDFGAAKERSTFRAALSATRAQFGLTVLPVIGASSIRCDRFLDRIAPSDGRSIVGRIGLASTEQADAAVLEAKRAFADWSRRSPLERIKCVERLADLLVKDKFAQAAWQVHEVGKQWAEADGDVAEAIDFCRYYARGAREMMAARRAGQTPGESSLYSYHPRGVALVIAPWNFPLAILAGMTVAAAITGNTVIMKPAEQSSVVAWKFFEMIREAGFPPGVINFLPGEGEVIGEHLVGHKDISLIAFTGSKNVGLHILRKAQQVVPGQRHVKRCIVEMGGKNAVIVDSDADLDEAVQGVIYSAFGYQGQKCSACSRVIVLDGVYDKFVERLVEAARSLSVGPAEDPWHFMGAVVDREAQERILGVVRQIQGSARILYQSGAPAEGFFVPLTIIAEDNPKSPLAQEEIFGPVLTVLRATTMERALAIANDTEFALTGGLFSRSPAHIAKVRGEMEVGNLYINRGITGAMVERHPFGGFKMSGAGAKTGGPDYLLQFVEARVVTENTVRRGFAPKDE